MFLIYHRLLMKLSFAREKENKQEKMSRQFFSFQVFETFGKLACINNFEVLLDLY